MAIEEAQRCLNCKHMPCVSGCPVNVQIPKFISLIAQGKFADACSAIKETSALPAVCGRVCPQETQCEAKCVRGIKGEPVAIGRLERFAADWDMKNGKHEIEKPVSNGHKVAVIGAGPAGLTCAGDLAKKGYDVTIFEAFHKAGGVLVYGIPDTDALQAGEVGYFTASIKNVKDTQVGDTITDAENPAAEASARLPARPAHGLLRHLHRGRLQIPRPAGRPGKAPAQRRLPDLRAGELRGPGLRLPVRLFGHAPHGDHPGAAGTGVRPGPGDHPALSVIYHVYKIRRHHGEGGQSPQLSGPRRYRARGGAVCEGDHHQPQRVCGQHHAHVPGPPGRVQGYAVSGHPPGRASLPDAPQRDHLRLLRRAQGQHQGLCLPGL